MKLKHKICLFIPNLKVGGAERVAVTLANYFVEYHHVDVIVLRNVGDLRSELSPEVNLISLDIRSMKKEFFGLKKLRHYLNENSPDALLCFMWPLTIVGVIARIFSRSKCRLVLSDHTTFSQTRWIKNSIKRYIFSTSVKLFYQKADSRVMVSDNASRDLELLANLPASSIQTIYNPLKVPRIKDNFKNNKKLNVTKKILTVGTLKWAKNHTLLLDAFELLYESNKHVSLTIVGDGELKSDLQQIVQKKGLDKVVTFTGQLLGADLQKEYFTSDVFVLASHYEGFSMVIAEALSHGVPVVSVDCKFGPKEILTSSSIGSLVPNHDAILLAKAMEESLLKEYDYRRLQERVMEFSVERVGDKYLQLLLG